MAFPSRHVIAGGLVAAGLAAAVPALTGQAPPPAPAGLIQSLSEPGGGLVIRSRSVATGLVSFASARGSGILLPGMAGAPADARALAFVQ